MSKGADFAFFLIHVGQMKDEDRHFSLSAKDIALLNPNTRTCPIFRSRRDAEITKGIYSRVAVFEKVGEKNFWQIHLFTMLHSSGAAHLFRDESFFLNNNGIRESNFWIVNDIRYLPLYEGKMFHQYDHRFASVELTSNIARPAQPMISNEKEHLEPWWTPYPRVWVGENEIEANSPRNINTHYFLVYKDVGS